MIFIGMIFIAIYFRWWINFEFFMWNNFYEWKSFKLLSIHFFLEIAFLLINNKPDGPKKISSSFST